MDAGNYIKETLEFESTKRTNYYLVLYVDGMTIEVMKVNGTPFDDETFLDYNELISDGYLLKVFNHNDVIVKDITELVPNHNTFNDQVIAHQYIYGNKQITIPIPKFRYWSGSQWITKDKENNNEE